jgi:cystathionine beta-lyase
MQRFDPEHPVSRKDGCFGADVIGAWIAEMDYAVAEPIRDVLARNLDASLLSYVDVQSRAELPAATSRWLASRLDWQVDAKEVFIVGDVMQGYESVIRLLKAPDAAVIVPLPNYSPLLSIPRCFGYQLVCVDSLRDDNGRYALDYDAIDKALEPGALFVLTNPWNPVGQMFTQGELLQLADVIEANKALVFADEIHFPLVLSQRLRHLPYAGLDERTRSHTVTAVSASKPFNLAALHCAQLVIPDDRLRSAWKRYAHFYGDASSRLGLHAQIVAYSDPRSQEWLEASLELIRTNRDLLLEHFQMRHPQLWASPTDATYLVWMDTAPLALPEPAEKFLLDRARVAVGGGATFGADDSFVRINIALNPERMQGMLARISKAFDDWRES